MTSVSQPTQPPSSASNNNGASQSAQSYASATRKAVSSPPVATGSSSQSPAVAVGNVAPVQHGKSSSISPVNGRSSIPPAVPVVSTPAIASSNGNAMEHSRKSSVTINGGYVANGSSKAIQFGSLAESPAATHSTPQISQSTASSAPIAIPSNPRVTSPAQSPSPIPQPTASGGGRPPAGLQSAGMTFGSHPGGDGDRHMRHASVPQAPLAPGAQPGHDRRLSGEGGMGGPNRGGFNPQGGRGRGYSNTYQNQQMGYPQGNHQFRGAPNQGRGGMPGPFPGRGGPMPQYPNSPHQANRSPALTNSVPSTPNMGQVMPMQNPQQYASYHPQYMPQPQVLHPSSLLHPPNSFKSGKNGKKFSKNGQQAAGKNNQHNFQSGDNFKTPSGELPCSFFSNQLEQIPESSERSASAAKPFFPPVATVPLFPPRTEKIDLSPESGNFDQILTRMQNYGYQAPPYDRMSGMPVPSPYAMYPQMQYMQGMPGQPQSPQPGYQQPFIPGQYQQQPQPQAMSRTPSQMSERPNSSLGQPQTPSMPASVIHQTPQAKAAASPSTFQRTTRRSAAIVIKNPDGDIVKLPSAKPPASPVPSNQSSKTPPVVVSTPTPPPKAATPQHVRTDSKRDETVMQEFKDRVRRAAEGEDAKASDAEGTDSEKPKAGEVKVTEEKKADTSAADAAAAAAKEKQDAEDELERQIKEMEEAEEAREKAEAEVLAKRAAEKAAADLVNAEKNKLLAEENDRKLKEQEREMERIEDEREQKRKDAEAKAAGIEVKSTDSKADAAPLTPSTLASKLGALKLGGDSGASTPASDDSMGPPPKVLGGEKKTKPAALNLAPLNTKPVEPPQPSAALQSLKSARFLSVLDASIYPTNISSPNPALNTAVTSKGKSFKYDKEFLLQFQKVFTEKPSLEFESQIKALIGDGDGGSSRAGSSRTPGGMGPRQGSNRAPGAFTMGTFGVGKTLPPGTTSQQRFEMSQGTMPRPAGANPMSGNFRSTGTFPGGMGPGRQPSGMGQPQSPRNTNPSRGGRQGSKRDNTSKHNVEAEKKMPLTAGMVLKPIEVTSTGWKPRSLAAQSATGVAGPAPGAAGASAHMEPDMVQRKVKAALNKMTPEKFDKIADQILTIAAQSKDEADGRTLRQVIQLTFEKATDEAHWASMYAKFCKRMLETMSPEIKDESILDKNGNVVSGGNLFRKYLLNRCQEEFERGWKMDLGDKPEGERGEEKTEEAVMLSDAYYIAAAAKRRGLGLVQFIGELYKLGMLTERIMHECVKKLVDYTGIPDEAEIESLTKLLKTIGGNLDSTEKGKPMMDIYFSRIVAMTDTPELPSRLKFMLMDIVDLRKKRWVSKEDNKGPKTLEEVRAEAEAAAAQKAAENARGPRGGGGGRMQPGRGDSRNFSNQYGNQPPIDYSKNTVATDDLRRLTNKGASRASGAPMSFAPTSMFSSRSNSGRKMGPGGSLSRTGDDSGASSRTGTPPQQKEKEPVATINAFSLLGDLNDHEPENQASPPLADSPVLTKTDLASGEKKGE
ncbi:hypothetical protein VE02_09146 [Pseudogymnoascus sp. 03VT05]|nr:hypothetical protein VE02_09146 [Pseudogymnoascus sp. 03VT05]